MGNHDGHYPPWNVSEPSQATRPRCRPSTPPQERCAWARSAALLGRRVRGHRHLRVLHARHPLQPRGRARSPLRRTHPDRLRPVDDQVRGGRRPLPGRRRRGDRRGAGDPPGGGSRRRALHPGRLLPHLGAQRAVGADLPQRAGSGPQRSRGAAHRHRADPAGRAQPGWYQRRRQGHGGDRGCRPGQPARGGHRSARPRRLRHCRGRGTQELFPVRASAVSACSPDTPEPSWRSPDSRASRSSPRRWPARCGGWRLGR